MSEEVPLHRNVQRIADLERARTIIDRWGIELGRRTVRGAFDADKRVETIEDAVELCHTAIDDGDQAERELGQNLLATVERVWLTTAQEALEHGNPGPALVIDLIMSAIAAGRASSNVTRFVGITDRLLKDYGREYLFVQPPD